jgi:hypothetical protein
MPLSTINWAIQSLFACKKALNWASSSVFLVVDNEKLDAL